jgi:SAM-dependent methyltransferase
MVSILKSLVRSTAQALGFRLERIAPDSRARNANRFREISSVQDEDGRESTKVKNLLQYTKSSDSPYNAEGFESAYHSIDLFGETIRGQRLPKSRIDITPYDFSSKVVMDLGCNQGGMLYAIADRIQAGIGVDYDSRMINAANRIRAAKETNHLSFYVFDLEKEPLVVLDQFVERKNVDIVFLLSVCMWISNWREVIRKAHELAPSLLFESNGSDEQQAEQIEELRRVYARVDLIQDASPDDPLQSRRKLLLCSR